MSANDKAHMSRRQARKLARYERWRVRRDRVRKRALSVDGAFRWFGNKTAQVVGSPWAFVIATLSLVVWAATGPHFHFSDTWQLVVNTGTSLVTFLMVFLIQNSQNRDTRIMQIKLDELIKSVEGTRHRLIDLEDCSDEELECLKREFNRMRKRDLVQSRE